MRQCREACANLKVTGQSGASISPSPMTALICGKLYPGEKHGNARPALSGGPPGYEPTKSKGGSYEIDALGTGAGESCTHRSTRDGVGGGGRASDAGARKNRLVIDRKTGRTGDHP